MTTVTAAESQDQYLQMLVTQLRNQDPLEPVAQDELTGQLAQFSTLEGIEQMNANFAQMLRNSEVAQQVNELTSASSLIGRDVQYQSDDGTSGGVVDAVEVAANGVAVIVEGEAVSLDRIQRLTATA